MALIAGGAWGFLIEPAMLRERSIDYRGWEGSALTVAFLSDLHAGSPHIDLRYVESLVARVNAREPDIVLFGGDIFASPMPGFSKVDRVAVASELTKMHAPLGRFAVLGNHEWWQGGDEARSLLEQHGFVIMENQARRVVRQDGSEFWVIGIGDDMTGHADPESAFAAVQDDLPRLTFMHDPATLLRTGPKVGVAFAGHLHGGQIYLPGFGALITPGQAPRKWAKGWTSLEVGDVYVSTGIGTMHPTGAGQCPSGIRDRDAEKSGMKLDIGCVEPVG